MPYLKPNNSENTYNVTIMPTRTQRGYAAVQFVGEEVPSDYTDGFQYFNDEDKMISDFSEYQYCYKDNIYATGEDEPVLPLPNNTSMGGGVPAGDPLAGTVAELVAQVNALQPHIEEKQVYVDDVSCEFQKSKEGAISAVLRVDGTEVPCAYEVSGDVIRVFWEEPLEMTGTVTLTIQ